MGLDDMRKRDTAIRWCGLVVLLMLLPALASAEDYVLQTGDELLIEVFLDPDLTRTLTIRPDGKLSYPFIGEFQAAGLTISELDDYLTEALSVYYEELDVNIMPITYAGQEFYVAGDVAQEGEYPLLSEVTVAEGILQAGISNRAATTNNTGAGFVSANNAGVRARSADPPEIVLLVRKTDDGRIVKPIYFKKFLTEGGYDGDILLEAGDILFVPENLKLVYVLGEVAAPGSIRWTPGMTALDALADSGHWTEDAKASAVYLVRREPDGSMTSYQLNLWNAIKRGDASNNPVLESGDTLYIPRNALAHIDYFFRLFNEGAVQSALDTYQQRLFIEQLD